MNMNQRLLSTQIARLAEAIRSAQSDTTPVADRVPSIQAGQRFGSGCLRADASDYTHTEGEIVNHSSRLLTREVNDAFMAILVDQLHFAPVTQDGLHLKLVNELHRPTTHFHLLDYAHSEDMKRRIRHVGEVFKRNMRALQRSLKNIHPHPGMELEVEYYSTGFAMRNFSDETLPHLPEFLRLFVTFVNTSLDTGDYDETLVKGLCALPYGESDAVEASATAPAAVPPPAPASRSISACLTALEEELYGASIQYTCTILRIEYLEKDILNCITTGQTIPARVLKLEKEMGL
jgi:hypothetical protein